MLGLRILATLVKYHITCTSGYYTWILCYIPLAYTSTNSLIVNSTLKVFSEGVKGGVGLTRGGVVRNRRSGVLRALDSSVSVNAVPCEDPSATRRGADRGRRTRGTISRALRTELPILQSENRWPEPWCSMPKPCSYTQPVLGFRR